MGEGRNQKGLLRLTVLILGVFLLIAPASAMEFDLGHDASLDFDVTVTFGSGIRVSDRKDGRTIPNESQQSLNSFQQALNQDDANQNFDKWDFINNKLTVLGDIDLKYKDFGLFVRPKAFYDRVYMTDNSNDSPGTNNPYRGGLTSSSDHWADRIKDIHGKDAEILDLFGYTTFRLFDMDLDIRVGRQNISWGESLLIIGGISSAQNPMDTAAATAVGTEVKEIFLPTESAYIQVGLTPDLGLSVYYQWQWRKTKVMEGGTFFSQGDMPDKIRAPMLAPDMGAWAIDSPQDPNNWDVIPKGDDHLARDSGQYGIRLMYVLPWLDGTEVGVYYINYHDKNPIFVLDYSDPSNINYYFDYPEDIKLYGVSVSSIVGPVNVSGEFSYRKDVVFRIMKERDLGGRLGVIEEPGSKDGDYWQAQASAIYTVPLSFFADGFTFTGEVACGKEVGTHMPDEFDTLPGGYGNQFSWMYSGMIMFDWYQVLSGLDTGLNIANSDVMRNTNLAGMAEGAASFSVGVDFIYKVVYKGSLVYENRYNRNIYKDRDTLALTLSYTF